MNPWTAGMGGLERLLTGLDDSVAAVPVLRPWSWGVAVVVLTLLVRTALLPTTVLQVRFVRAMAAVRPEVDAIRERIGADRALLLKDPKEYRARWSRREEEESDLLRERGIRWYVGLVPPLVQIPVYVALVGVLANRRVHEELTPATVSFAADPAASVLHAEQAGPALWTLVALLALCVHAGQRQRVHRGPEPVPARMRPVRLWLYPLAAFLLALNLGLAVLLSLLVGCAWTIAQNALTFGPRPVPEPVPA